MSGHNKWQQIRHQKGVADQKRGQLFSKLARVITLAARKGVDPGTNFQLQAAIERARGLNMPKENIERAIKKASEREAELLAEVVVQAIGPGSTGLTIRAVTDNKNRTINEIKNILTKNEAKIVPEGSLNWMFGGGWVPTSPVEITDPAVRTKLDKLFEELDAQDDVQNIYSNIK